MTKCFALIISWYQWKNLCTGVSDVSGYCLYYNSIVRTTFTQTAGQGILRYILPHWSTSPCSLNLIYLKYVWCVISNYILIYSRYELGPPIFVGLVGCLFILLGAVLYTVTVYQVICPERYSNSSIFTLFPVAAEFIPHHWLWQCFDLTVKWYMPMEEEHTWPLAPEEAHTTDPPGCMNLIWAPDDPAAPRAQSSLRQHRRKSQKEMHLCSCYVVCSYLLFFFMLFISCYLEKTSHTLHVWYTVLCWLIICWLYCDVTKAHITNTIVTGICITGYIVISFKTFVPIKKILCLSTYFP